MPIVITYPTINNITIYINGIFCSIFSIKYMKKIYPNNNQIKVMKIIIRIKAFDNAYIKVCTNLSDIMFSKYSKLIFTEQFN